MKNSTVVSTAPIPTVSSLDSERESLHRQMLSVVAHDFKTPLASIIGSLEVYTQMYNMLSVEKRAELIKVALQEAHRLDAFVTNMLDMAKLENDAVKPKYENVDIGALLEECLTIMDAEPPNSIIDIHALSGPVIGKVDAALLTRAIGLALDNAVKYSDTPAKIGVEFGQDSSGYIRIHDNGKGVPEDQLEAIFSKYTRLTQQTPKSGGGIGLGLAIVRRIMQLLNGTAVAANHPEGGAVIILRFPLADIPA